MCESCYVGDKLTDVIGSGHTHEGSVVAYGSSFRAVESALGRELE